MKKIDMDFVMTKLLEFGLSGANAVGAAFVTYILLKSILKTQNVSEPALAFVSLGVAGVIGVISGLIRYQKLKKQHMNYR